ncbi:dihydropteroate synthase [Hathewaya proteolytica DSM 3090]|uniref:Dihydropteroate synthase n=1 Tax=Hathewaya proteolytica DSM 3090 TaxID=1121331 RepID=A0A1M6N6Q4_9CLOT|nr:dihydropteroate synthase [Hathewaya proteolytica]SHJ91313.1 dihydropteroate synthase [Hathewaya proteolytica DSM 3090]
MIIGGKQFNVGEKAYIMGILNVTPDSFSDGGSYKNMDDVLYRVKEMIEQGADIIDIGGESTRPGHVQISQEEEIERVCPAIEAIKKEFDTVISLDTYKAMVAEAGIKSGADLINDIWGLKYDKDMAKVIADYNVSCCLMHNRNNKDYKDFVSDVINDLQECVDIAKESGINSDKIILDPGVGFAKNVEQNLKIINNVDKIVHMGYPVLLGTSRKSCIGLTLDLDVTQRVEGTLATSVIGIMKGCAFVRVHDIKENVRVIRMTEAIINSRI